MGSEWCISLTCSSSFPLLTRSYLPEWFCIPPFFLQNNHLQPSQTSFVFFRFILTWSYHADKFGLSPLFQHNHLQPLQTLSSSTGHSMPTSSPFPPPLFKLDHQQLWQALVVSPFINVITPPCLGSPFPTFSNMLTWNPGKLLSSSLLSKWSYLLEKFRISSLVRHDDKQFWQASHSSPVWTWTCTPWLSTPCLFPVCVCAGHGGATEVPAVPGSAGEEPTETHEKPQGEYTALPFYSQWRPLNGQEFRTRWSFQIRYRVCGFGNVLR